MLWWKEKSNNEQTKGQFLILFYCLIKMLHAKTFHWYISLFCRKDQWFQCKVAMILMMTSMNNKHIVGPFDHVWMVSFSFLFLLFILILSTCLCIDSLFHSWFDRKGIECCRHSTMACSGHVHYYQIFESELSNKTKIPKRCLISYWKTEMPQHASFWRRRHKWQLLVWGKSS